MHVKYRQDNFHHMTWYTSTCGIMAMSLLYMLALLLNVCIIEPRIQWLFMAGVAIMGGHYKTKIISSVGHPSSDSGEQLVLFTVVFNGWGIDIVLQVPRDSANLAENG